MALKPIKVSQLTSYIKRVLQLDPLLGNVSVVGEISNLKYHNTGHVYFTLKDEGSRISCFLSADAKRHLRYELADGMEITATGYISVYERGGSYSLNVRDISISGVGSLTVAFEQLKKKLSEEGLFDPKHKKPLPSFPERVAVATSPTGAAVRDVLKIIQGRNNIVDVLVYPCLVQGPGAAADIAAAVDDINRRFSDVDVIILGRGGGSMEELWPFNEEAVARSVFGSRIPIISAVGHETDFTICDFVADVRAETPTAAAQLAVPDTAALRDYITGQKHQMYQNLKRLVQYMALRVENKNREQLALLLADRITRYEMHLLKQKAALDAMSPFAVMNRGYGAVLDSDNRLVFSLSALAEGDPLQVVLKDGRVDCRVEALHPNEEKEVMQDA